MNKKTLTLVIPVQGEKVLLGMKKRGFGEGKWNGFGGKIEMGETIEEAAARELLEEAGIIAKDLKKHSVTVFEFQENPELLEVHIFSTSLFHGEPIESEEMLPQWFHVDEIPFDNMWADDEYWLPKLLNNEKWNAHIVFSPDGKQIVDIRFNEFLN